MNFLKYLVHRNTQKILRRIWTVLILTFVCERLYESQQTPDGLMNSNFAAFPQSSLQRVGRPDSLVVMAAGSFLPLSHVGTREVSAAVCFL